MYPGKMTISYDISDKKEKVDDSLIPEVESTLQFFSLVGCSLYGMEKKSWKKNILYGITQSARLAMLITLCYLGPIRFAYYSQLYITQKVKPLAVLLFKMSMFMNDVHAIITVIMLIFKSQEIITLFHDRIYLDNYNQAETNKKNENHVLGNIVRLLVLVSFGIFTSLDSVSPILMGWSPSLSMSLNFFSGFFYMVQFLFTFEMLRLAYKLSDIVFDNQLRRLQPYKQNLNKKVVDEVKTNIVELGDLLTQLCKTFSLPMWSALFNFVTLGVTTASLLFIGVPLYTKVFCILNQLILLTFFYLLSVCSQRILHKFDAVHMTLLDKSIDTYENFYDHIRRNSTSSDLYETIAVFEFRIYRRYFKILCLGDLFAINLHCFAFALGFVLNYSVLLIQTSL